jgi:hypothetical protein
VEVVVFVKGGTEVEFVLVVGREVVAVQREPMSPDPEAVPVQGSEERVTIVVVVTELCDMEIAEVQAPMRRLVTVVTSVMVAVYGNQYQGELEVLEITHCTSESNRAWSDAEARASARVNCTRTCTSCVEWDCASYCESGPN